jgi:hypothetical protein
MCHMPTGILSYYLRPKALAAFYLTTREAVEREREQGVR